jgi:cobalamin biosynthesis Co2+ chelatase CbiK
MNGQKILFGKGGKTEMKRSYSLLIAVMMALVMVMSMSVTAFAYTAIEDDGDRTNVKPGEMGVVYSNQGMLRTIDDGTSVQDNGDGTVTVTVQSSKSKTWGKITKLALIEQTATAAQKDEAAAGVVFEDDTFYEDKSVSRKFTFTIPKTDVGKMIPICRYQEGAWKDFTKQAYYIVEKLPGELTPEKADGVMMTISAATRRKVDDGYEVDIVMDSIAYSKVFKGYASVANKDDTGAVEINVDKEKEKSTVTLKFDKLNEDTVFAFKGTKYYNRTLKVTNDKLIYGTTQISLDQFDDMTLEEALARAKDDTSVDTVNALIEAIQSQKRDKNTDKYCTIAKAYYDALSSRDKKQLEDPDYFGLDTGDASKDDPLNTLPDQERELLVVSFGTSYNESRVLTIGAIEKALQKAYPAFAVRRAFTAQIIINHVQSRDGEKIDNVKQAMDKAVEAGVKKLVVQPTHLMSGKEYDELKEEIDEYNDKIKISYAKPLLNSDSDKATVAKAMVEETVKLSDYKSLEEAEKDNCAFVFMGHGTAHEAAATYDAMQDKFEELGYKNVIVGTVEGIPEDTSLPAVKAAIDAKGFKKVILRPMMVVAGDHANNDMAGDWAEALAKGGEVEVEGEDKPVDIGKGLGEDNVTSQIHGLGEIVPVQMLYVKHTGAVVNNLLVYEINEQILRAAKNKDIIGVYDMLLKYFDEYRELADEVVADLRKGDTTKLEEYGRMLDEFIALGNKYAVKLQEMPEVKAAVEKALDKAEILRDIIDKYLGEPDPENPPSWDDVVEALKAAQADLEDALIDLAKEVSQELLKEATETAIEKAKDWAHDAGFTDEDIEEFIEQAKLIAAIVAEYAEM